MSRQDMAKVFRSLKQKGAEKTLVIILTTVSTGKAS